ncbi:hypothetical protein KCP70_11200 [Salmonella enterica subsp. enterica]|nr:hypothetical protein KCP70_11200 [Salmonella enterica subsp. enterica]
MLIQLTHCVKSGLDNAPIGHTSALLLIFFLNERANQRNGNGIIPIFQLVINLHRLFFVATGGFQLLIRQPMPFWRCGVEKVATENENSGNERGCAKTSPVNWLFCNKIPAAG